MRTLPTPSEMHVMRALWGLGSATGNEVRSALEAAGRAYTSNAHAVMLKRLVEKGVVARCLAPAGTVGYVYAHIIDRDALAARIVEGL